MRTREDGDRSLMKMGQRFWTIMARAKSRRCEAIARLLGGILLAFLPLRLAALDLHIAPNGNDANVGTAAAPFATLTRARDAVRTLKSGAGLPPEGVTIWLHAGTYNFPATVAFDARDSGTATIPVVYAARGEVRITGGRAVEPAAFRLVDSASPVWSRLDAAARGQVYVADLRAQGVSDFGTLRPRGFGLSAAAPLELFCNGRPMTLAQWPNRRDPWVRTATAISDRQFTYAGTRPERWAQASELWLHGFWKEAWADFHVKVAAINPAAKTITLTAPPGTYGIEDDRPYIAYNLLEEIDEPGEYFVDRSSGLLYFWPPAPLTGATLQVSLLETPLLQFAGTQYVTLRDLVFEAGRSGLVRIDSGDHLRLERCLLRNAGQYAAMVGGSFNGLDHCEVVACGEDGVRLSGGTRATLVAGENYVTNSRLHQVSRLAWTYHPAIAISGCGQRAANNLIDDLPHSAILFSGNNHVLEANEIRRVCRITSDAGAIYTGRDWGFRGNVIRGNFIHHIQTGQEGFGAHGVYLDDCVSGVEVSGNVFHRIDDIAIMAGGGRDLIMRANLIAECGFGHRNDDRGRTRITNTPGDSWNLVAKLSAEGIRYQQPPWSTTFPACAAIPNSWDAVQLGLWRNPEGCVFSDNIGWGNTTWTAETNPSGTGVFRVYAGMANNEPAHAALFDEEGSVDRVRRPAQLRSNASGFAPVAFAAIGRTWSGQAAATVAPPAPWLEGAVVSARQIDLQWTDEGNLSRVQETGFALERRNEPSGAWQVVRAWGPDVDFATAGGLAPASTYSFRVRAFNAVGSVYSNVSTLTTEAAPMIPGAAVRVEAEAAIAVVSEVGTLGTVGASNANLDSGQSVRLYDPGDTLRIAFSVPVAGTYRVGVRVRSGGGSGARSYWPNGYRFKLDGADVTLRGDATTVSAQDPSYGISYWGTMYSGALALSAGAHAIEVRAVSSFGVADFLEFAPLAPRPVTSYPDWQAVHFATDQLADDRVAGAAARPAGDALANLIKYSLGLDPWSATESSGLRVTTAAGQSRMTYVRPAGLGDVSYAIEASDDGTNWLAYAQTSLGRSGAGELMEATGPARRLFRLKVSRGSVFAVSETLTAEGRDARAPRLSNLSVRAVSGAGAGVLIAGFTLGGAGTKRLLARGVGPGLTAFGVTSALTDPRIELYRGAVSLLGNDNWSGNATEAGSLTATGARVGAFALVAGSRDAAALATLGPGGYSVQVAGVGGTTGVALAELYDADPDAATSALRLSNLSARSEVGVGGEILLGGFNVVGSGSHALLVRAVGPTLARFGVGGVLTDPRLEVFRGSTVIASNDNWASQTDGGTLASVEAAATRAGAFALDVASRDAALLLLAPAGSYTVQVSGVGATTGVALLEIYELP
jgi:hypothetical protein